MSLSSDLTVAPIASSSPVGAGTSSSQGSSTSVPGQTAGAAAFSLSTEVEWTSHRIAENLSSSLALLGNDLEQYVLENFKIATELTQMPQTDFSSGDGTQKSAVYTQLATFPGTDAVPLSSASASVRLTNGITVYITPLDPTPGASAAVQATHFSGSQAIQHAALLKETALYATLTSAQSSQNQTISGMKTAVGTQPDQSQAASSAVLTRVLLHSADSIEVGTGSPFPIFEESSGPIFAALTLADISADSPLMIPGNGTLELFYTGTGEDAVFTILTGERAYAAGLTPAQIAQFMNSGTPAPLLFTSLDGLPDTITLSLFLSSLMDERTRRVMLRTPPPPGWEPDIIAMELSGSASVQPQKELKLRRAARRTLLGSLTLTASVLSLKPIGMYLGGVTALAGSMAQAAQEDDADENHEIYDVRTAVLRTQLLRESMLRCGSGPVSDPLDAQSIYSLLD
ncbi:MAG: hypothetical protein H6Q60_1355 [Oscillospiraceae bacterium]|nr:hypothetical protein [Oscillospiraceae bacterium]